MMNSDDYPTIREDIKTAILRLKSMSLEDLKKEMDAKFAGTLIFTAVVSISQS